MNAAKAPTAKLPTATSTSFASLAERRGAGARPLTAVQTDAIFRPLRHVWLILALTAVAAGAGSSATTRVAALEAAGKVRTDFGGDEDGVWAVAIQRDGKIVAAGGGAPGPGLQRDFALARYTVAGRLDRSFGTGGRVLTDFGGSPASDDFAATVAVRRDGKIVAAGRSGNGRDLALARYLNDGRLDPTFADGGKRSVPFPAGRLDVSPVLIQRDGKIVVVGAEALAGGAQSRFVVLRYLPDGTLDPTFGTEGKVVTAFDESPLDGAWAAALQRDGKLVVAGESYDTSGTFHARFALVRYLHDGRLDPTFGTDGRTVTTIRANAEDVPYGIAIQGDGKIVVVGDSRLETTTAPSDFALARYTRDGRLDAGFGSGGKVLTGFRRPDSIDSATAVVLQRDNKIVAAGGTWLRNGPADFALARYLPDGRLDRTFGRGGKVRTDFGRNDGASALVLQRNGTIVAAGTTQRSIRSGVLVERKRDFALVRYDTNGRVDS